MSNQKRYQWNRNLMVGLYAISALPIVAATAVAKEPDAGQNALEEVVVTAQFRRQDLQETPIAITAMTGDMLEARSQTNIVEIANQAPNVSLRPGIAQGGSSLTAFIRGIGASDFDPAFEPGVGMYVDDVYFATLPGALFALLDLDRIEILRGPQGTLLGRNSLGGAIKLYSKRPGENESGFFSATYGSRHRVDVQGAAGFHLADGIDLRITGVSKRQDGYIKRLDFGCVNPPGSALNPSVANGGIASQGRPGQSCVNGLDGDVGYQGARAQLRLRPANSLDINLIADYTREDRATTGTVLLDATTPPGSPIPGAPQIQPPGINVPYDRRFVCGRFCNYATYYNPANPTYEFSATRAEPSIRFSGWGLSSQVNWDISDSLKLTSITARREYSTSFATDDDFSPLAIGISDGHLEFRFTSQELRLSGLLVHPNIDYTIGGFYSDQLTLYSQREDLPSFMLSYSAPNLRTPAKSRAVFAHTAWHATDAWSLSLGVRYTKEEKEQTFIRLLPDESAPLPLFASVQDLVGQYSGHRVDYRANVSYIVTSGVMLYGQFSTGFKGGGVNSRPFVPEQIRTYRPETLNAWEVGLKTDLFDHRMRLNFAAFLNKYKDIVLVVRSCPQFGGFPACILPANVGDADLTGLEAEMTVRPFGGLSIDASLSYLNFRYTRLDPDIAPSGVSKGMVAPFSPRWKGSFGMQYEADLDTAGSLTPRFDTAYQSSVFTNAANASTNRIHPYAITNARLTWLNANRDLEVAAEVTNVFDKYYFNNIFDDIGGLGQITAIPGRPREWALTTTKRF